MKKYFLLIVLLVCILVPLVIGAMTQTIDGHPKGYWWRGGAKDHAWIWAKEVESILEGTTSTTHLYLEPGTVPDDAEGRFYYDSTGNAIKLNTGGTTWVTLESSSGNSLDSSYDAGATIAVDGDAVTLTVADDDDNVALALVMEDTTNDPCTLTITLSSGVSGAGLYINGVSSGTDALGDNWSIANTGVGTFLSFVLENSETIDNADDGEITFSDGTDDTAISWSGTTLQWTTDTSIDTVSWGDLDAHTGLASLTFDSAASTITCTGNSDAEDLTIAQAGTSTVSLILSSAGATTDALSLLTTDASGVLKINSNASTIDIDAADGIAIDVAGAGGQDIVIKNTGGSITLEATEANADAIWLKASNAAGGINIDCGTGTLDIDVAGAINIDNSTAVDISLTSAAGSINIKPAQAGVDDALVLETTGAGSGMQITSLADIDITTTGTAGEDISLVNTDGSIILSATEDIADGIFINATKGGIDITADGDPAKDLDLVCTNGSTNISAGEDIATAIVINASTGGIDITADGAAAKDLDLTCTNGSVNITAGEADAAAITLASTGGIDLTSASSYDIDITAYDGKILLDANEAAADQFKVDCRGQINGDAINLETTDGGIMLNADGSSYGDIELNAADDLILTAVGATTITLGAEAATYQGNLLPATVIKKTITTGSLSTADCGYCLQVSADAQTITLPVTVAGVHFWIMCIAADDGALLTVELDNSDKFIGAGFTPADGEAMTIPKTGQNYGDYIKVAAHTDGWIITEMVGTWAEASP